MQQNAQTEGSVKTEEKFYDLRDRLFENIQSEGKKEKTLRKNEHFLWDL